LISDRLPDHIRPIIGTNATPVYPTLTSIGSRSLYMMIFDEKEFDNLEYVDLSTSALLTDTWTQAVHPLGGFGNALGPTNPDISQDEPSTSQPYESGPDFEEEYHDYRDDIDPTRMKAIPPIIPDDQKLEALKALRDKGSMYDGKTQSPDNRHGLKKPTEKASQTTSRPQGRGVKGYF